MNAIALIAALAIGQLWGPLPQRPPAWGTPGSGSSPDCSPPSSAARIDAKAFYDSINGDQLAAAVVRVSVQDRNGQTSLGSGTLVEAYDDGSGLVVTNNHVVADAASATSGSVFYRSGQQSSFKILDVDRLWDVAVLEVQASNVRPVAIGSDPSAGETLMIGGYGGNNRLEFQAGSYVCGLTRLPGFPAGWFELRPCRARQGDSGGPVFNARGQFVGALWGSGNPNDRRDPDPNHTACIKISRIVALLQSVRQRLGRRLRGELPGQSNPQRPSLPPILPGPIAGQPAAPAQPAPPQNDSPSSGSAAGGELATILDRIKGLEGKLAERAKEAAGPAISEGGRLAEDGIQAAAPSLVAGLAEKLLPLALKTLGVTLGGATGLGGVGLAGWGAIKLLKGVGGVIVRRRSAANAAKAVKTAADQQGTASGTTPTGAGMPHSFDPQALVASEVARLASALKGDLQTSLQSQIDAKLSIIGQQAKATAEIVAAKPDPAPQFVPTQVDNPQLIALEKALETFGGQTPANAKWVNLIYSFRDQLLNRAKAA